MAEPRIRFRSLPLAVRAATMLAFFLAWVLFAELVIDRYGLDRFLPFYRVGDVCPYELVVLAILGFAWWRAHRRGGRGELAGALEWSVPLTSSRAPPGSARARPRAGPAASPPPRRP